MQPTTETLVTALDGIEKHPLNFRGDRSACTGADLKPVDFADRRNFGRGTRKERLVGGEKIVQFKRPFSHIEPQCPGYLNGCVPGDPHQY